MAMTNFTELKRSLLLPKSFQPGSLEYVYAVMDFHPVLGKKSGNSFLCEFYRNTDNSLKRYQLPVASDLRRMKVNEDEHKAILTALVGTKYGAARRLLKKHLDDMKAKMVGRIDLAT